MSHINMVATIHKIPETQANNSWSGDKYLKELYNYLSTDKNVIQIEHNKEYYVGLMYSKNPSESTNVYFICIKVEMIPFPIIGEELEFFKIQTSNWEARPAKEFATLTKQLENYLSKNN